MTECSGTRSMYAWGIAWWGVWSVCWTDRCWSKECGLSSIALSFGVLFQPFFWSRFSGLLRLHRSLHVKTLSTLFDSIEIPTKFYGLPQTLFSVWSSMVLLDLCENTWCILASGKFFLIPSFIIIIKKRSIKKACCYPMRDKNTAYTVIAPWF